MPRVQIKSLENRAALATKKKAFSKYILPSSGTTQYYRQKLQPISKIQSKVGQWCPR